MRPERNACLNLYCALQMNPSEGLEASLASLGLSWSHAAGAAATRISSIWYALRHRAQHQTTSLQAESEADFHAKQLFQQGKSHPSSPARIPEPPPAGSYSACLATITSIPSPSASLQLYAARAHLAQGDTASAVKLAAGPSAAAKAVRLLAQRPQNAVSDAHTLINAVQPGSEGFGTVHAVLGTLLQLEGETGDALDVLAAGADAEDQEWCAPRST